MNRPIKKTFASGLLVLVLAGCSNRATVNQNLTFPADAKQPFLILEDVLGAKSSEHAGMMPRLKTILFGAPLSDPLLRPVASVQNGEQLYIADADAGKVFVYALQDGAYQQSGSFGEDELRAPGGITIWNDTLVVSDGDAGIICRFDHEFGLIDTLPVRGLIRPGQLKVNPQNNELFIVDAPGHHVVSIDSDGQVTGRIKHKQTGDQLLGSPMAVDFTEDGHIVVLDGLSRRVEIFKPDYSYESGFGGYDRVPGSFASPKGLAISADGNVFISDAAFGNIQIFDINGALLYFFGQTGKEAGEFLLPGSISIDQSNRLYVMDQFNSRIQIFHYLAQGE